MLKLHRLELSGFKSFVDPARLDFAGGMTAIVGPNGCGKSNVADAVVWALGERSAKSLRGDTMEDVIFGGSASRKPLGMAEVNLTLTGPPDFPGSDDGRVVIGRRLFRSGESEYLLNGKRVRLKDVRDLLMDTGLGIRAYSVIEQGSIGMILSGKPQERRRLIEEAAGVTRYKERRRIAEIKLEEARANLARLDDIVSEVERTMRSLKRQAGAARRYQERKAEYRQLLRQVMDSRWSRLAADLARLGARVGEHVARETELSAALHREEAALAAGREELDELARRLAERHRRDSELAATIEGKQEFLKGSRQRLDEIAERIAAGRSATADREKAVTAARAQLDELEAGRERIRRERDLAASELSDDESRITQVDRLVAESTQRLESFRARLLASIGELTATRNRLHREQLEKEKGALRRRHLDEELGRKEKDRRQAEEEAGAAAARVDELRGRERERAGERERLSGAVAELERQRTDLDDTIRSLESRLELLRQRHDLLTELAQAQEERRERVRRSLAVAGLDGIGFLSDLLRVPPGWERSVDLYLGDLADAVVLPAGSDRLGLARVLGSGASTLRLLAPGDGGIRAERPTDPAVQAPLGEALGLPPEIAAALPPAYLADSAAEAARLARAYPGTAFLCRDRLWAQAGVLHVQGTEAQPGLLARAQDLAEIAASLPDLDQERTGAEADRRRAEEEIASRRRQLAGIDEELDGLRRDLAVASARREDADGRRRRLAVECETLAEEAAEVVRELGLAADRTARLAADLTRFEGLHAELESAFDGSQKEVESARQERESARTSGASRRGRLDLFEARLESNQQEIARVRREIEEGERQIASWREEAATLRRREQEIQQARTRAEAALQEALERRAATRDDLRDEGERVEEQRARVKALEEGIEAVRAERDEVRSRLSEVKVEEAAVKQDVAHLRASFREEFSQDPPEGGGEAPEAPLDELEADLARCREALERIGPVNLLAADEFAEHQQRHEFLSEQRADVAGSVESLTRTIREINQTSGERFKAAFEQVNEHFRTTFTELFRGGGAEMRLLDEEDLLESGIEIVARPPGKRLQNIMLLSGGEKALTAIALLFALFRTKPSPFCILDEVDAPLDDVNTLRFVELLRHRAVDTQFVIITHNKITMEAASVLYGVTMQERGVSDLVSVELDQVQPGAAVAPEAAAVPASA